MFYFVAKNRFPSNIIEDSNSNLSFPSPAPVSEDSQEAVAELASKKDSVVKPGKQGWKSWLRSIFVSSK